jgi:MFS family permease
MSTGASPERVYRALLRLYPEPFRERFGDELVQLCGDLLRDARAGRGGRDGVGVTWLRIILDVVQTAPAEHLEQRRVARSLTRPASAVMKGLGLLGILGGLLFLAAFIPELPWSWLVFNLRLVLFEVGAIAVIFGMLSLRPPRWRWPTLLLGATAALANAWHLVMTIMFVNRPQPPAPDAEFRPIYGLAAMTMWFADAAFALVAFRLGVASKWGSLSLAVGSILAATGVSGLGMTQWLGDLAEPVTLVGVALVGLGWILLGLAVASRRRPPAERTAQAAPRDA